MSCCLKKKKEKKIWLYMTRLPENASEDLIPDKVWPKQRTANKVGEREETFQNLSEANTSDRDILPNSITRVEGCNSMPDVRESDRRQYISLPLFWVTVQASTLAFLMLLSINHGRRWGSKPAGGGVLSQVTDQTYSCRSMIEALQ